MYANYIANLNLNVNQIIIQSKFDAAFDNLLQFALNDVTTCK